MFAEFGKTLAMLKVDVEKAEKQAINCQMKYSGQYKLWESSEVLPKILCSQDGV